MTFPKAVCVHVCTHAYYVCLHLSKLVSWRNPTGWLNASWFSPLLPLSLPHLSLFPFPFSVFLSPIPPLTQSILKVNPRGICFLLPLFDFTYSVFGLALGCWSSAKGEKWQHWWRVQLGLLSWFQPTSSDWSSRFRPAFSGWFSCRFSLPKLTSGRLDFLSCGCFVVSKSI